MDEDVPVNNIRNSSDSRRDSADSKLDETAALSNWLQSNVDLPHDEDKDVLLTFLNWAGTDVQDFVKKFYRVRQHYYQVFQNLTPNSEPFSKYSSVAVAPFTTSLSPQWVILGTWLLNDDYTKFNFYHQIRLVFAELDLLLHENCLFGKRIVILMDLSLMTMKHLRSITGFAAKCVSELLTSAVPATLNSILLINSPDWVTDFTKMFPLIDFHILDDIEDAVNFIPEEFLPSDMNGFPESPTRLELNNLFIGRLWKHSSWFAHEELKRENELYIYSTKAYPVKLNNERGKKKRGVKVKASD